MPLNDIIAGLDNRPDHSTGEPPKAANGPPKTPKETTMRTNRYLPPYLHIQNVQSRNFTLLAMAGTVLTLTRYLGRLL